MTPCTVVAQISDTHVKRTGELAYGVVDTAEALRRCIQYLNELVPRPEIVVVSGDLVDSGQDEEYAHFRELIAPLATPFAILPGNHDDVDAMRRSFRDHAYLTEVGPLCAVLRLNGLVLVLLDSSVPNAAYGTLAPETLRWLDATLGDDPQVPALIFLHHPPFVTGIRHMDVQNLRNADELAAIVSRHERIRLVAAGHVHRAAITLFAGVPTMIAPGTSHAVAFDLDPKGSPALRLETPGIYLHVWRPGAGYGELVSHVLPIGAFDGPYPFFGADGRLL